MGKEVWRRMGQEHSDPYNLEDWYLDVDEPIILFPFREMISALL